MPLIPTRLACSCSMQPAQSLKTGRIVGIEVLIRWPGRAKPIRPDDIISFAEQTELITEAEDCVIVQTTIDMCHSLGYQVVAVFRQVSRLSIKIES